MLLPDLEKIEQVMVEIFNEKLKAKGKATTARPNAKSNSKGKVSGGSSDQVPKKAPCKKICQHCKTHGGPYQMHNTSDCLRHDKDGKPLGAAAGKPSDAMKPDKKYGGEKQWPSCRSCSRLMQKPRKLVHPRNARSMSMTSVV
jgi:hypothetical protein